MTGGKAESYKIKVTQEYIIELYYQDGIIADSKEEANKIAINDAINLAFEDDGLHAVTHDESETANGFVGLTNSYDPHVEIVYNINDVSLGIKRELHRKGFVNE